MVLHLLDVRDDRVVEAVVDVAVEIEEAPLLNQLVRKFSHELLGRVDI